MEYNRTYDIVDGTGLAVLALVGAVLSGIASVSLFGVTASSTVAVGSFAISIAFIIGVVDLVGLMIYNDVGLSELQDAKDDEVDTQAKEDLAGVILGVAGLGGMEFLAEVQSIVTSNDIVAIIATILVFVPGLIVVHRLSEEDGDDDE